MKFTFQEQFLQISRYPTTDNRSLMPWSAAEQYMLDYWAAREGDNPSLAIWNDRFGFLATVLHAQQPSSVLSYTSQKISLEQNLAANKRELDESLFFNPLDELPPFQMGLMRIPKSLDLFGLHLRQAALSLEPGGVVIAGFMTRHFSAQLLERAGQYFESVEQSRAWKKSRLLILAGPKKADTPIRMHQVKLDEEAVLTQYPGVFSANKVDPATRLLLEHIQVRAEDQDILDLGAGNGVIARALYQQYPDKKYHLLDDAYLAIASSKLNMSGEGIYHYQADSLKSFEDAAFDLVASNPPFHLGYENNIEVSLRLFAEVRRCLRPGGRFLLVANRHLNYGTQLEPLFKRVKLVHENQKFSIYSCE